MEIVVLGQCQEQAPGVQLSREWLPRLPLELGPGSAVARQIRLGTGFEDEGMRTGLQLKTILPESTTMLVLVAE
jgi:hypothetical protein